MEAASKACKEIGLAVMATTASIVAVFVPVAFMQGIIGRFFMQFGLTVAFAVTVSLFVAFTLTPMLAARMLKHEEKQKKNFLARGIDRLLDVVDGIYRTVLGWALRHRAITLVVGVASLFGSCQLLNVISTEFLPEEDRGEFAVKIEMPTGTDLETTRAYVLRVTPALRAIPGAELTFTKIGGGAAGEVNKAEVTVALVSSKKRGYSQSQAMVYARKLMKNYPGPSSISVEKIDAIAGSGGFRQQEIQFNIRGNNYEELNRAAAKVIAELKRRGGYVDLRLDLSRRQARAAPSTSIETAPPTSACRCRSSPRPCAPTSPETRSPSSPPRGERYDVRVRLPKEAARGAPRTIVSLRVRSSEQDRLVPLSQIVKVTRLAAPRRSSAKTGSARSRCWPTCRGIALGDAIKESRRRSPPRCCSKHLSKRLGRHGRGHARVVSDT
jgi:HAE1 family hydrophobic/amphiphilic exporter-1